MPPFSLTRSHTTGTAASDRAPTAPSVRREFQHHKLIRREYDQLTDQTRVSVTTHRGTYFLWMQRPRLTFFSVRAGAGVAQPPATVFLIFRTLNPQVPTTNRLTLTCDGSPRELDITPTFWLEPGAMTSSRHFMYELPTATFAELLGCSTASVALGDVTAPFARDQLEALRDFAAQ